MGLDARGYSRGLGILWDPTRVSSEGLQGTRYYLSVGFKVEGFPIPRGVTNVYGPHNAGKMRDFHQSLKILREGMANVHWVVGGYFNLMTSLEEHKGGMCRMEEECETFIETIEELGLVDIIPREGWFTSNNKRTGDRHITSILDCFVVTKSII